MPHVHYYCQTFDTDTRTGRPVASSLSPLLADITLTSKDTVVLYLSSLHFGAPTPYLHLNDNDVNTLDVFFRDVQQRCEAAVCNVEVRVMLGGAGGAYTVLFSDFDMYYTMLRDFLRKYPFIRGVDLDVEEELDSDPTQALACIQNLIGRLHTDFATHHPSESATHPFIISMAPVAFSLTDDSVGMGGFVYKDLLQSSYGSMIAQYNVQAYGSYDYSTYQSIVQNGFPPDTLVFGMLGNEFAQATPFATAMTALQRISTKYPNHKGVILWEYGDTKIDGVAWGQASRRAMSVSDTPLVFQLDRVLTNYMVEPTRRIVQDGCTLM